MRAKVLKIRYVVCSKSSLITKADAILRAALHASCCQFNMVLKSDKSLSMIVGVLLLSGCAVPGSKLVTSDTIVSPSAPAASLIGNASPGDAVDMPDGNSFNEQVVVVGDDYTAASGRLCRRLRSDSDQQLSRIVCKKESGEWYSPRSLTPASKPDTQSMVPQTLNSTSSVKPAAVDAEMPDSIVVVDLGEADLQATDGDVQSREPSVPSERHVIESGETLWSFSRRVTGNALNWNEIAEFNTIDDSRLLSAGDTLLVPKSLVRGEL